MKTITYILFLFIFIAACGQNYEDINSVSSSEFINILKTDSALVILDVRTERELSGPLGKIDGVINIPVQKLSDRVDELTKYKGNSIAVICRSGNRSRIGTKILKENGFDAFNVEGGMKQFVKETREQK